MKLITYRYKQTEAIGVLTPAGRVIPAKACGLPYDSMNDLIRKGTPAELDALRAAAAGAAPDAGLDPAGIELLAPIPSPLQDVLCLGLNYTEHAKEAKGYSAEAFSSEKQTAIYFSKRVNECLPHNGILPDCSAVTQKLDYESELGVILGRDAKDVQPGTAKDYIFGYTVINDFSARDLQTAHKQWYRGKSLDGFTPMGPCITTADEIAYPPQLDIGSTVNGEVRQAGNTSCFIHDIDEVLEELTRGMTLKAGTVIATGTPKGVAMGMEKPVFLKKGDVVTCSIEGIGDLTTVIG